MAMKMKYRYFNVENNPPYYMNERCDICGKVRKCAAGEFENGAKVVCESCFDKGLATVYIPPNIASKLYGYDAEDKINELRHTPPVCWDKENEWPVCCDDFMTFEGFWHDYVLNHPEYTDCYEDFSQVASEDFEHPVLHMEEVYNGLEEDYAAYLFSCPHCGKRTFIIQEDSDYKLVQEYLSQEAMKAGTEQISVTANSFQKKDSYGWDDLNTALLVKDEYLPSFPKFKVLYRVMLILANIFLFSNMYITFNYKMYACSRLSDGLSLASIILTLIAFILYFKYQNYYAPMEMPDVKHRPVEERKRYKCCTIGLSSLLCAMTCFVSAFRYGIYYRFLMMEAEYIAVAAVAFFVPLMILIWVYREFSEIYKEYRMGMGNFVVSAVFFSLAMAIFALQILSWILYFGCW